MYVKSNKLPWGDLAVFAAAALWGCIGIFTRNLFAAGYTAIQIVAVRAVLTCLCVLCIILCKDRTLLRIRPRDLWMFFGTGICSFLFFNICYMSSIGENSLSVACILMYTSPFWVTALSAPLFKETLTPRKLGALLICFVGCAMVCLSSSLRLTLPAGLIYGLLSGLGYALYSIFGKYAAAKYNTLTVTFYTFLFASLGSIPICRPTALLPLLSDPLNLVLTVGVAVFCTILPYLLYTYGLSKTTAGKAAVLAIVEPVFAALVGWTVFGEALGVLGILGIVAVAGGLMLLESRKKQPTEKKP